AYGGNGNCHYRLHVGTFPRPTAAYPVGGTLGEETEIRFLGDPAGEIVRKLTLPAASVADFGLEVSDEHGVAPSEVPFRLFEQGNVLEQEPNDEFPQATSATLPLAFNGIIQEAKDVDLFKFQAKKGEVWEIECYARRVRSPLDPVMMLHKADGGQLAANDDSRGPDSYIRFNVPADGEYFVKVFDHLTRGGADFVYRIEFTPVTPKLTLGIPRVRRYSQDRQTIYVPKGNRFATLISAKRENFGGPLTLDGKDLPQGVTMHAREMPANMTLMPVVFEAAADAPIAGKLVAFTARHSDPNVKISGRFENTADLVRYRNNQILWKKDVERLAMAVIDEVPFKLEIVQPKVPIVRDGAMQLKIVAHKKEGWDEQINVQFPFRPPGIGAASSVNMPKGQNEVLYPLNANGGAAIGKWPVYVIGSANVNGAAWAASQLAELDIADRYVQFEITRTAVEQGQSTQLFCKITHARPFEGAAKVQLLGLPNKVTAPELEFTKDTTELVFNVTTDPTSPAGRHKNVFAQVTITENGEPVVHANVGATELRIDQPLP
ncbi:MAG: PPC domain-containing protein, partial [Planctomycetaceae bacterium]